MQDPDWWAFNNADGKLERCDMRQFKADLDAAIRYQKEREETMRLDFHIADNAGTPHVSITDAVSGDALFQSVFSVDRCELAEKISKRFNSHEKLIEALRSTLTALEVIDFSAIDGAYDTIPFAQIESALQLAEAGTVAAAECEYCAYDGVDVLTHNPDAHAENDDPAYVAAAESGQQT